MSHLAQPAVVGRPQLQQSELLRQRQKAGLPLAETARLLGRSYACVKSYASDHGILQGEKPWTRAEDACMVLLVRKGSSPAEISSGEMPRAQAVATAARALSADSG